MDKADQRIVDNGESQQEVSSTELININLNYSLIFISHVL